MRKGLALPLAVAVAALAAGPAAASHRTGEEAPHSCLGEFHSSAARNPEFHPLGQVVRSVLLPLAHPFGREFVKDRATDCDGLE